MANLKRKVYALVGLAIIVVVGFLGWSTYFGAGTQTSSPVTTNTTPTTASLTTSIVTTQGGTTTTAPTSTIDYEVLLTRKDQGEGRVWVEAVLLTKDYILAKGEDPAQYNLDKQIVFEISVDTHAGSLLEYNFKELFSLRDDKGNVYPAIEWRDISLDSHHRSGILIFSRFDGGGNPIIDGETKFIELVAKNIAGVPERALRWDLPIPG